MAEEVTQAAVPQFLEEMEPLEAADLITITVMAQEVAQQDKVTTAETAYQAFQSVTEAAEAEADSPKPEKITPIRQVVEDAAVMELLTIGMTEQHVIMPAAAGDPATADLVQQAMAA